MCAGGGSLGRLRPDCFGQHNLNLWVAGLVVVTWLLALPLVVWRCVSTTSGERCGKIRRAMGFRQKVGGVLGACDLFQTETTTLGCLLHSKDAALVVPDPTRPVPTRYALGGIRVGVKHRRGSSTRSLGPKPARRGLPTRRQRGSHSLPRRLTPRRRLGWPTTVGSEKESRDAEIAGEKNKADQRRKTILAPITKVWRRDGGNACPDCSSNEH